MMKTSVLYLALLMVASVANGRSTSWPETSTQTDDNQYTTPRADVESRKRSGAKGATGEEDEYTLGDAIHQVVQKVLRLQEQKATTALREAMKQLVEERDEVIRALPHSLHERMRRLEDRLDVLGNRSIPTTWRDGESALGVRVSIDQLEKRVLKLEANECIALEQVNPNLETLREQRDRHSSPGETATTPSPSAAAAPSTSKSSILSSINALGATGTRGTELNATEAATDQVRARQRLELRIQEVKSKRDRARAAPSSLGERLCKAAFEQRVGNVIRLLDSGAYVNYTNSIGDSPLISAFHSQEATQAASYTVVSLLLEWGADVNATNVEGWSALHYAAYNDSNGKVVALLISARADVNASNLNGTTPLHLAAFNDNGAVVRALAAAGADVNTRDKDGETPLHYAAQRNAEEAVLALLAAGARKNLKCWSGGCKDKTPLDLANSYGVVELLLL